MTSSCPRSRPRPTFTATCASRSSFCSKVKDVFGSSVIVAIDPSYLPLSTNSKLSRPVGVNCRSAVCFLVFLRQNHARDSPQVVAYGYNGPVLQEFQKRGALSVTDLQDQPTAGFEHPARLRNQTLINFQAGWPGVERGVGFVVGYLRFQHFSCGNIRGI